MVVGCLGDIVFQVSEETVETLQDVEWSGEARYTVHQRHLQNALTEFTGVEPDKIRFSMQLTPLLGVDIIGELVKIWTYERSGEAVPTDLGRIRLNEPETVNAVLQNIALVLATPKGSVPMYRDFGLPQDFLDKPIPVAKARMIASVREAVEEWEPRATVQSISFTDAPQEPGRLIPRVEVEIHVEGA